jgi:hypothetical protein
MIMNFKLFLYLIQAIPTPPRSPTMPPMSNNTNIFDIGIDDDPNNDDNYEEGDNDVLPAPGLSTHSSEIDWNEPEEHANSNGEFVNESTSGSENVNQQVINFFILFAFTSTGNYFFSIFRTHQWCQCQCPAARTSSTLTTTRREAMCYRNRQRDRTCGLLFIQAMPTRNQKPTTATLTGMSRNNLPMPIPMESSSTRAHSGVKMSSINSRLFSLLLSFIIYFRP